MTSSPFFPRLFLHGWRWFGACRLLPLAVLGASLTMEASVPAPVPARPNVLLILADNWRYPHASCLGDRTVATPHFDRLAGAGVRFDRAFCPVPSCSPTRASLLTGRAAHELAEAVNLWSGFPATYRTLTGELQAAGYRLGYTGKGWAPGNYTASGRRENPVGPRYADFARFLAAGPAEQPFFFWLGNLDTAIGQWDYRPEAAAGLDVATLTVPAHLPDTPLVRANLLAYYARVRLFDRVVGETLAALERAGQRDRTLVICTSDNGWQIPRGLANCYDDGTHVPLVFAGPGIPAGRTSEAFVSLSEFTPTVLDLIGLRPWPGITTRSFAGVVRGTEAGSDRDAVFIERERHANVRRGDLGYPVRGIRTRDYLYLMNLRPDRWPAGDPQQHQSVGPFGDVDNGPIKELLLRAGAAPDSPYRRHYDLVFGPRPAEELYDLARDSAQVHNVAAQPEYAAIKAALRQRVQAWMQATHDPRCDPRNDQPDTYRYHGDVNTWDQDNFDGAHLFGKGTSPH